MNVLQQWLSTFPDHAFVPLFQFAADSTVVTHQRGKALDRRILTRSPEFDAAMIQLVEEEPRDDSWLGLLYIMGVGPVEAFTPPSVGKAERPGKSGNLSANIERIRTNHGCFARWGYNTDYHIDDLSHALFGFEAYRLPTRKYRAWAAVLFSVVDPPTLRETVHIYLAPWRMGSRGPSGLTGSLPSAAKEIIALASALLGDRLLNRDGG